MTVDPFKAASSTLSRLYRDRVTIYGAKPIIRNGATEIKDALIVSNLACKLSLNNQQSSDDGQFGTDAYDVKLFLENGVSVPAGAILDVTDVNGNTTRYKRSSAGYTAYASHQEVTMIRDEKAMVKL